MYHYMLPLTDADSDIQQYSQCESDFQNYFRECSHEQQPERCDDKTDSGCAEEEVDCVAALSAMEMAIESE